MGKTEECSNDLYDHRFQTYLQVTKFNIWSISSSSHWKFMIDLFLWHQNSEIIHKSNSRLDPRFGHLKNIVKQVLFTTVMTNHYFLSNYLSMLIMPWKLLTSKLKSSNDKQQILQLIWWRWNKHTASKLVKIFQN